MDIEHLKTWIGRQETAVDQAARSPLARLSALLDHDEKLWTEGAVPPLGHWLYFLPDARQSQIGADGHPKLGGFLPPISLPRRMWAGGRLAWSAPLPVGGAIRRVSTIQDVTPKRGASGEMVFVTLRHDIYSGDVLALSEEQDLVYRQPAEGPAAPPPPASAEPRPADARRVVSPGPVELFRFSALTFNAHRIHYDRDYATNEEGYRGLVVHGPFIATLLMDHLLRTRPGAKVASFSFRAQRPLFDGAPITLNLAQVEGGVDLWAFGPQGEVAMSAKAELVA